MKTKNPVQSFLEGMSMLHPHMVRMGTQVPGRREAGTVTAAVCAISRLVQAFTRHFSALFEQDCLGDDRYTELP